MEATTAKIRQLAEAFSYDAPLKSLAPYGNGHINNTYRVETEKGTPYIFQKVNRAVFVKPLEVMANVAAVTEHVRKKIIARGGNPDREGMTLVPAKDGKTYVQDENGDVWRVYTFIGDTVAYELPETEEIFAQAALGFGMFQQALADFPAVKLHETIANFHNTPARMQQLKDAIKKDAANRVKEVSEEIAFTLKREMDAGILVNLLSEGKLPLRVTHNDTKLNNVLMDAKTGKAICVIDLDTVMPGLIAYDFGDAIRFGANTAVEDEKDLTKVQLSLPMYRAYTRGFLQGAAGTLWPEEIAQLPRGAWMMTLECGIRFLADYINGDTYFKIAYPQHNLVRARNQFKLTVEMEKHWGEMVSITAEEAENIKE